MRSIHNPAIEAYIISAVILSGLMLTSCKSPQKNESGQVQEITEEDEIVTSEPVVDTTEEITVELDNIPDEKDMNSTIEVAEKKQTITKTITTKTITKKSPESEVIKDTVSVKTEIKDTKNVENEKKVVTSEVTKQAIKKVETEKKENLKDNWNIPAKYLTMKNPYAGSKPDLKIARIMFSKHCKSCHGSGGEGNGAKSGQFDIKIRSFKTPGFKVQKPGIVYYKSFYGNTNMPGFEKKIPDEEDRWSLVVYIMSL